VTIKDAAAHEYLANLERRINEWQAVYCEAELRRSAFAELQNNNPVFKSC